MEPLLPGQVLYDRADIDRLPTGSIIAWGEDADEEIGIVKRTPSGHLSFSNTHTYWVFESWIVEPPFRIVRMGKGKGELC